jgi:C_GCAxxG_C_C family probable redox protein
VLAVSEHLWGRVDEGLLRASSGLAGGLGCSHLEMCGVLSGGALIIGALHGRTLPSEDDTECNRLACAFRDRFMQAFDTVRCFDLRASGYGSDGQWPCAVLIERAVGILLEVLESGQLACLPPIAE